jgi:hypothetical protein
VKRLILVILFMPTFCFGACWIDVYTDKETDIYLNTCSLAQVGKYKKAWLRWVYAEESVSSRDPQEKYDETKSLTYFDCASKTSATVRVIYYSPEPQNKVVDSWDIPLTDAKFKDVVPDTLGYVELRAVCNLKRKK